jgi:hypothetical protein
LFQFSCEQQWQKLGSSGKSSALKPGNSGYHLWNSIKSLKFGFLSSKKE